MKVTLLAGACVTLLNLPIWADVTVVRTLKLVPHTSEGELRARNTVQIQGQKSRRQIDLYPEGAVGREFSWPLKTYTLIALDKGVVYRMDSPRQGYQKLSLASWRKRVHQDAVSTTKWEITQSWSRVLPDQETRTLLGVDCSKLVYEWRFELAHPETYAKKQYAVRTTLWLTEVTPALQRVLAEQSVFQQAYHKKMGEAPLEDMNALTLEYGGQMTGIDKQTLYEALRQGTSKLKKIVGYPIASRAEWFLVGSKTNKPLFTIDSELEAMSLNPLPESAFLPPKNTRSDPDSYDLDATLLSQATGSK